MRAVWMAVLALATAGCAGGYQVGLGPYATSEGEVGALAQVAVSVGIGLDDGAVIETAGAAVGPAMDANEAAMMVHAGLGYAHFDKPVSVQADAQVGAFGPVDRGGYDASFMFGASVAVWDGRGLKRTSGGGKGVSLKTRTVSGFGGRLQGYWLEGTQSRGNQSRGGKKRRNGALFALLATWQGFGAFSL